MSQHTDSTQPQTPLDDRKITGTGSYDLQKNFEDMELADDSDNYSEDFYSDEDRKQGEDEFEDRSDDSFDQQETVKQANLNEVVNIYQKYLGPGEQH